MSKQLQLAPMTVHEIDAVNGAGWKGYVAGYLVGRMAGKSHDESKKVGEVGSAIEDVVTGQ